MPNDQRYEDDAIFEQKYRIAYLIATFLADKLTPSERNELDAWVGLNKENLLLFEELTDERQLKQTLQWFKELDVEKAKRRVHNKLHLQKEINFWNRWLPVVVAACVIALAGIGTWYFTSNKKTTLSQTKQTPHVQTVPGSKQTILTMANGNVFVLDSAARGTLPNSDDVTIYTSDSSVTFTATANADNITQDQNSITVPSGATYKIVLADGTRVWLNAGSELRFPSVFSKGARDVAIQGEGYFEVAKDAHAPFQVKAGGGVITVLGTHFNVHAYGDEGTVATTLLEGSVVISNEAVKMQLRPGEQGIYSTSSGAIEKKKIAELSNITAWKEGYFIFRDDDIQAIAKALGRWYDIQVVFRQPLNRHFSGTFSKKEPLQKILASLEATGEVHFETQDQILYVRP